MKVTSFVFGRTRLILMLVALLAWTACAARAQSSTGRLTVSLSVQSSISLVFKTNPASPAAGFCPLTNSGTNNVALDLGTAAFPGNSYAGCGNYAHMAGAIYQVSSAFDVVVTKANTSSPSYRLAAEISTAPPANVSWLVNNIPLTNTGFTALDATDAYGAAVTKTLQVQVKNNVPAQALMEIITFLATAN